MTAPAQPPDSTDTIRETVRRHYGDAAARARQGKAACCTPATGSPGCCGSTSTSRDPITADLYEAGQTADLPLEALLASLGCGNPTALAELMPGDVVLDLGSGGGVDVLLSAKRVGPRGKVYGLDMTDEMLELALENKAKAGATNVEFLKGHIEAIPLPSNTVDAIISNCVINLSGDKRRVLAEAFRVLRPGGRFAVSDLVTRGPLPDPVRRSMALWSGCVAGALDELEFLELLAATGFREPSIEPTRVYTRDDALALVGGSGLDPAVADQLEGRLLSAFVRARKPLPGEPIERAGRSAVATPEHDRGGATSGLSLPTVRDAYPADLPGIEQLLAGNGLPLDGVRESLGDFLVAQSGAEIVGVAGLEVCGRNALLRSVAVAPEYRGRGVGRTLVMQLIARAQARGLDALYLLTTTAEHYFPSFGFRKVERSDVPAEVRATQEFTQACPASATAMCRHLNDA